MRYLFAFFSVFLLLPIAHSQLPTGPGMVNEPLPAAIRLQVTASQEAITSTTKIVLLNDAGTTITPQVQISTNTQTIAWTGLALQEKTYQVRIMVRNRGVWSVVNKADFKTLDCFALLPRIAALAQNVPGMEAVCAAAGIAPDNERRRLLALYVAAVNKEIGDSNARAKVLQGQLVPVQAVSP